jgi:hypothetical protein
MFCVQPFHYVRIATFTALTAENTVFMDIMTCGSCRRLLVTDIVVPSSQILVTLMINAVFSSETSVLTRATRRNFPEEGIP